VVEENLFDRAKAIGAEALRAGTGGFEAIGPMDSPEPHQAEACAVALFRMGAVREDPSHEPAGGGAGLCRPRDEPGFVRALTEMANKISQALGSAPAQRIPDRAIGRRER